MQSKIPQIPPSRSPGLGAMVWRGLNRRCPNCGKGKLFRGFYHLRRNCPSCAMVFQRDPVDLLAFMYISTALLTGLFVLLMLLWQPSDLAGGRWIIIGMALAMILGTMPMRKGVALAVELWLQRHVEEPWE